MTIATPFSLPTLLVGAVAMCGCQYLSGASELAVVGAESQQPSWDCRGKPLKFDPNYVVPYARPVRNLADDSVIEDVEVWACESADQDCANPAATDLDKDGEIKFDLKASFFGYFILSSPGMMPAIVELSRPVGQMRALPELRMVESAKFLQFSAAMGVIPDETLGHAQYWVYDCDSERASGVMVDVADKLPESATKYYALDGRLPLTSIDRTDEYGAGGFANLPAGFLAFRAYVAADGSTISEFAARIRPGHITYMVIEPD